MKSVYAHGAMFVADVGPIIEERITVGRDLLRPGDWLTHIVCKTDTWEWPNGVQYVGYIREQGNMMILFRQYGMDRAGMYGFWRFEGGCLLVCGPNGGRDYEPIGVTRMAAPENEPDLRTVTTRQIRMEAT